MPTDPNATMMKAISIRTSASVKPRVPRSRRAALGAFRTAARVRMTPMSLRQKMCQRRPGVRRPGFSIGSRAGARPAERRLSGLSGSSTSSSGQAAVDDTDAATLHRDGARATELRQRSGDQLTDGAQARGDVVARPGKIEDVASAAPRFHQEEAAQPCRHVAEREILDQRSEPAQAPGEHGDDAERDLRTSPAESEKLTARNEEEPRVVLSDGRRDAAGSVEERRVRQPGPDRFGVERLLAPPP